MVGDAVETVSKDPERHKDGQGVEGRQNAVLDGGSRRFILTEEL
jgi:hypothetical protein